MQKQDKTIYKNHQDELIRRLKQGEQKSQFRLYKEYYPRMYHLGLSIIRDEDQTEDITNRAFLNALDNIHTFNEKQNLSNWLEEIVIETSLEEKNKRKDTFQNQKEKQENKKNKRTKKKRSINHLRSLISRITP
jgi:DNA-directed RNA polymerase specialized sigma24 family protein